ncbi:hypothetical protein ERJ75_000733200 [Trypanosoma vivax]|uniref:Uncharacterized protein n=1 Tax=Trypanosoma vivax (strain Y486) TaxID=1055687 RepID=G0TX93_TRYVY|nr:hypothetical protein TRVL_07338 [Trypanosoma vivax]KAH8614247.1 hypothetical protein ERJ75_000733200 [Trypanosoma vivax]CCC48583.1 conserved hypothetical protein [Trypanosoma vivax Y486]
MTSIRPDTNPQSNDITVTPFLQEHSAVLALLAHAAVNSVHTRVNEFVFEVLCSLDETLVVMYPEVALLRDVHQIRRTLRDLQMCPKENRLTHRVSVQKSFESMYRVLPDPLLLTISKTIGKVGENEDYFRALEPHLLDLAEYIQQVIIRETKSLQCRAKIIELQLRGVAPFVA